MTILVIMLLTPFLFIFCYEYFSSYKRSNVLKKIGWVKTKVDGVVVFEKNHHFISEKRLRMMSSKSFFTRLEVVNKK